ncbi:OB-fold protein [Parasediminibacterium sp. JCM 36343]|uniref:OB-fold protein n=1 Tax=Parasediminibacterium sp. JCM 36343 TaxID=3374279 RepID=UPI00397CDB2F
MDKKKIVIGVLLAGVIGLIGVWYFIFYKPTHFKRDVADEQAIVVTAKDIVKEFQANEAAANKKYLNKAVEVTGEVTEAKKDQDGKPTVTLKSDDSFSNVFCTLKGDKLLEAKGGTTISVKGIVTGFLSDVVIIDAIVTKQ